MAKFLYVMRHAKSSWDDPSLDDFERPLARRGEKTARRMAREVARLRPSPTLVLCSPARRAVQTCEPIAGRLGDEVHVEMDDELYGASASQLFARLRALPDEAGAVLVIGHNPGLEDLLLELVGTRKASRAERLLNGLPTGALAVLRVRGRWSELDATTVSFEALILPKAIAHSAE